MTLKELRHTEVYNLKCEQIEFIMNNLFTTDGYKQTAKCTLVYLFLRHPETLNMTVDFFLNIAYDICRNYQNGLSSDNNETEFDWDKLEKEIKERTFREKLDSYS